MRTGWWQALVRGVGGEPDRFALVYSGAYPDGTRVELTEAQLAQQAGENVRCTAVYGDEDAVTGLLVNPRLLAKAPPLWFIEMRESTGRPPAVNLMAFTGHGQPAGLLADVAAASNLDVTGDDQLGAVRWYPATGEVDQLYVSPARRRLGIATALLRAAETLSLARGWAPLWGDGQRTALGEQLRNASCWRHRAADLTHVAPPMTPGER